MVGSEITIMKIEIICAAYAFVSTLCKYILGFCGYFCSKHELARVLTVLVRGWGLVA